MSKLLDEVNASVTNERVADQTEDKGSFAFENIPEGKYPARFIGWVEIGKRKGGMWQGTQKPDTYKAYAYFELLSKKLAKEIEVDGVKKTIYPIHREMMDVKTGEKANLTKMFRKMAAGRKNITHIAQMLEEAFWITVVHNTKGEGKDKKTYDNIRNADGEWLVIPPMKEIEEDGEITTVPVQMKEQTVPTMLMLWDDPSMGQWDSIKGNGKFTQRIKKSGDVEAHEVNHNMGYLQFICTTDAMDYEGSALQAILAGTALEGAVIDDELPDLPAEEADDTPKPVADAEAVDDPLAGIDIEDEH